MENARANINAALDNWESNNGNKDDVKRDVLRLKLEKRYFNDNIETLFQKNIKEFEDLGLELTVGWVREQ